MITKSGLLIEVVPLELIDELWPQFKPYLDKVVEVAHGEVLIDEVYKRLQSGEEVIVGVFDGATVVGCCVLGISVFETGKKVLQMPYCGGQNMKDWIAEGFELVKQIAKGQDCTHIRGCGRAGWDRVLPDLVKIRTVYECEVTL